MFRRVIFQLFVFSFPIICTSCAKETIEERHWESVIYVQNYTSADIDSLYIYSSTDHFYTNFKPLIIRDLSSGVISDYYAFEDIEITMLFRAYIDNDSISHDWTYPNFSIDPAGSVLVPLGTHYFGIIECDTTKKILEIGLIDYSRYVPPF